MADHTGETRDDDFVDVESTDGPRQDGALLAAGAILVLGLLFCVLIFLVAG